MVFYRMTNPLVRAAEKAAELNLRAALILIEKQQELLSDRYISASERLTAAVENKTNSASLVANLTIARIDIQATKDLPGYADKYDPGTRGFIDLAKTSVDTALSLLDTEQAILDALHIDISVEVNIALTDKEANKRLIDSLKAALKAVLKAEQSS